MSKQEKKDKSVKEALRALADERQKSGLTLSDDQIEFIVKVVRQCAG